MRRSAIAAVHATLLLAGAGVAHAQVPLDTIRTIARIDAEGRRLGAAYGSTIWPGYRPDTIPALYALPQRGFVLVGWDRAMPSGFVRVEGLPRVGWSDSAHESTASTAELLSGATVAQVTASSLDPAYLLPTTFHEAFHVFENAARRSTSWFGETENSYYVASYPVFDVANEAGFALEGRILAAALEAKSVARRRQLARQFVAVRQARLQRLDASYAEFDRASEMHEGLAEYALVRALELIVAHEPADWQSDARRRLAAKWTTLASLTDDGHNSFRIRYYKTGPAIATLLDRLAPHTWKTTVMHGLVTLDGALAIESGFDAPAHALRDSATSTFSASALRDTAEHQVADRERAELAQVDSILTQPGLHLVLDPDSLPGRRFGICGFDPQNILEVTPAEQLHTRWVNVCAGKSLDADLHTPAIHDDSTGTFRAVVSPRDSVYIAAAGAPVQPNALREPSVLTDLVVVGPHARVSSNRAVVVQRGDTLRVVPLP
jgi:hypothetical protein